MPPALFFFLLFVLMAAVILPIVITSMSFKQKRWKMEFESRKEPSSSSDELSKSELKALIQQAVHESNAPILKRLEVLEAEQRETKNRKIDVSLIENDAYNLKSESKSKSVGRNPNQV